MWLAEAAGRRAEKTTSGPAAAKRNGAVALIPSVLFGILHLSEAPAQ
jgi:hypothetical protein